MTSTTATLSPPDAWSSPTHGKPKFSFPPTSLTPTIIPCIRTHYSFTFQGDIARPRDLPRSVEIQARALPRSRLACIIPRSGVRLWSPQMPGPCPRVGHGVDDDSELARRVRIPSRNRCRRPPRSASAGVHPPIRFVSSRPLPSLRAWMLLLVLTRAAVRIAPVSQWPEAVQMHHQTPVVDREGYGARSTSRLNCPLYILLHR